LDKKTGRYKFPTTSEHIIEMGSPSIPRKWIFTLSNSPFLILLRKNMNPRKYGNLASSTG
jgi:hypothetical protein